MLCLLMGLLALGASLPGTSSRDFPGKSTTPQVYVYPPHPEEMRLGSGKLNLICHIQGFYRADDIFWLKNDITVPDDSYINTPVLKDNPAEAYFSFSKLTVNETSWDDDDTFTCLVVGRDGAQSSVRRSQG